LFESKNPKKTIVIAIIVIFLLSCILVSASNHTGSASVTPSQPNSDQGISVAPQNNDGSYTITYQPKSFDGSDKVEQLQRWRRTVNDISVEKTSYSSVQVGSHMNTGFDYQGDRGIYYGYDFLPLLIFDLTGFPYHATKVELKLNGCCLSSSYRVDIHDVIRPSLGGSAMWVSGNAYDLLAEQTLSRTAVASGVFPGGSGRGWEWKSFDITDLYNNWKSGITPNNGVMIQSTGYCWFSLDADNSPKLSITYTPTICIDPGHGGSDPGAVVSNVNEKDINLKIASFIPDLLKEQKIDSFLTRADDTNPARTSRANMANTEGATLFVGVHCDSVYPVTAPHGTSTIYMQGTFLDFYLAENIYQSLKGAMIGMRYGGTYDRSRIMLAQDTEARDLTVLIRTRMPAMIAEVAFLSNDDDRNYISKSGNQLLAAIGISSGIREYLKWYNLGGGIQLAHRNALRIIGHCPIDLEITDSIGRVFSKTTNEIPDAIYDEGPDADTVYLPDADGYHIKVIPEEGALPTDTFTLKVTMDGVTTVLAENVAIADIPNTPYTYGAIVPLENQVSFKQTGACENPTVTYSLDNGPDLSGTVPFSVPVTSGQSISYAYQSVVPSITGVQHVLTGASPDSPQTVTSDIEIYGNYKTQYYLTDSSAKSSALPSTGWYYAGTVIAASVPTIVFGETGVQYVCTGWSGSGDAPVSGTSSTVTFTLNSPSAIVWNWKTQYQVSFSPIPALGGIESPSKTAYYDQGTALSISATPNCGYAFYSWSSNTRSITFTNSASACTTATVNGAGTLTATFALVVSGNKQITLTGSNNIVMILGGNNQIRATQATATTIIKTGTGNNMINLGGGNNIVKETAGGNDVITTGNGDNDINIIANGNYLITTGCGNDKIQITGKGNSIIDAGDGNNIVTISGTSNNLIITGKGNDVVNAGEGNNIVTAGDGNNQVTAGKGNNQILTGSGSDIVMAGTGNNNILTGVGDDRIVVGSGNNYIDGGLGYDVCIHGKGHNTILNC
jgi:N-acetylmuramoyl-L-alanine amidase